VICWERESVSKKTAAFVRLMCKANGSEVEFQLYNEVLVYVSGALSSPITSKLRVKIQLELASLVWLAGESFRAVDILGEAVRYALENRIDFYHLFSRSYCFGNFCDFNAIDSYLIPLKEQCRHSSLLWPYFESCTRRLTVSSVI